MTKKEVIIAVKDIKKLHKELTDAKIGRGNMVQAGIEEARQIVELWFLEVLSKN